MLHFHSPTVLLYLMRTLESHSRLLFLASEKSRIEDDHLDNHLEKLLYGSFSPKYLFIAFRKDMKNPLEMLLLDLLFGCTKAISLEKKLKLINSSYFSALAISPRIQIGPKDGRDDGVISR